MKRLSINNKPLASVLSFLAIALIGISGCENPSPASPEAKKVPEITVISPTCATLQWTVRQPASLAAFEETPIVPRITGYVQKWNVDIGDRVKKGAVLAELWIPDLTAELNQKKVEVRQARRMLAVAESHLAAMAATIEEARAGVSRAKANFQFWKMQHARISKLDRSVIDKQVKEETRNQLQSAEAGVKESEAKVKRTEADRAESEAARNKSREDIAVAEAARDKVQTLVDYATLTAPFDGVITQRNISTGDFVQPPSGARAEPLYVVQRRDRMRVFVDVPETEVVWVKEETPARIVIPVLKGRVYSGTVRRMAYSLKQQSRTLRAEIDLPNPDDLLRPGMYAYATLQVERSNVLSLPAGAIALQGDVNEGYENFCFLLEAGKLRRTRIEVGRRGQKRVEVMKKEKEGEWSDFTGAEKVVLGELASLSDGQEVKEAMRN